jgi:hypothetical protein
MSLRREVVDLAAADGEEEPPPTPTFAVLVP